MKKSLLLPVVVLLVTAIPGASPAVAGVPSPESETPLLSYRTFVPLAPHWDIVWDHRLTRRGAVLIPAAPEPGQGYWRLVKAVWYAENEPPVAGQHHIFVDTIDAGRARQPGVPLEVTSLDAGTLFKTLLTEPKPGELYAANFDMYALAPAYRVIPVDGNPADGMTNLGLGSIEYPYYSVHTSYGFVWQWTVAPAATP